MPSASTTKNAIRELEEDLFEYAAARNFGELHVKIDNETNLKAIVAIHSTKLGPALGGCRCIEYSSSTSAMIDAMRLARAMSYKAALVNIPYGGGKSVLIKPLNIPDRSAYFRSFGRFINELNGRYITAVDSGTSISDMDNIAKETPYVASLSTHKDEPSPYTAIGVFRGIEAAVKFKLQRDDLDGIHVAIQGLGKVGYHLAEKLYAAGCQLTVTDVNETLVEKCRQAFKAETVSPENITNVACDVFAPCALGAIINDNTLPHLKASIVAGSANNQLARAHHGMTAHERGILYAPDYVINAGGLIYAAGMYENSPLEMIENKLNNISNTLLQIFERSLQEDRPTSDIANTMAQERIAE